MPIGSYISKAKASILYILQILENYSSKENPLSAKQIQIKLAEEPYNMPLDRDTIKATLEELQSFYDEGIICSGITEQNNGKDYKYAWYYNKPFTDEEIVSLIDDVLNSLNKKQEEALRVSKKLTNMLSPTYQLKYEYISDKKVIDKDNVNYETFIILNQLIDYTKDVNKTDEFIHVSFYFATHKEEKGKIVRKYSNKRYNVIPISVVEVNKYYYLIAIHENSDRLYHYRIDLMSELDKEEKVSDNKKIKNIIRDNIGREFKINKYINNHLYMFYESEEFHGIKNNVREITLKLYKKDNIGLTFFVDAFGNNYEIIQSNKNYSIVKVKCIPSALVLFIKQYMDRVEVLKPIEVRKVVYDDIEKDMKILLQRNQ